MYILIPVIFLLLVAISDVGFNLDLHIKLKDDKIEFEPNMVKENKFAINIFGFIPIYTVKIFDGKKKEKKRKNKKSSNKNVVKNVLKRIKVKHLYLSFGFNTYSYILNSYINALINSTLCIAFNYNSRVIDISKLYYQIYNSECPAVLDLSTKISINVLEGLLAFIRGKINDKRQLKMKISE